MEERKRGKDDRENGDGEKGSGQDVNKRTDGLYGVLQDDSLSQHCSPHFPEDTSQLLEANVN